MKRSTRILAAGCVLIASAAHAATPFAIRGTLPWHNFLSGPTAWNFEDYRKYLDHMAELGFNFVGFHCYTGGELRYVSYVEPLIRVEYRNVLPRAEFDTSLTARWGYRPLATADFAFNTGKQFTARAFGCDAALLPDNDEDRYGQAQELMLRVIRHAHSRGIKVCLGFEFGIVPPEFLSVMPPSAMLHSPYLPDPTHPASREILRAYLDDIVRAYPELDYVWLWLHEHSFAGGKPVLSESFQKYFDENGKLFGAAKDEMTAFNGAWGLAYITQAYEHLQDIAPQMKLAISGWGGDKQLPLLLEGLHEALPKEIIFSCLNPWSPTGRQNDVMGRLDGREVWVIPWLESDNQLWHPQPRVSLLADSVAAAEKQHAAGVIGIHWRTEDIRANFDAFADLLAEPPLPADRKQLNKDEIAGFVKNFYAKWCAVEYGPIAGKDVAAALAKLDIDQTLAAVSSPEYYPYDPSWGRLRGDAETAMRDMLDAVTKARRETKNASHRENLEHLENTLRFVLLLHEVGLRIEPAYKLKDALLREGKEAKDVTERVRAALDEFKKAPLDELFETCAARVRSRGELGVLSSLNQKLWLTAVDLKTFLDTRK